MRLAVVSNYLNHHQSYLCNELYNLCEEFYFIATEKIPEKRLQMGYEDMNYKYPYVIRMYEDKRQSYAAESIIKTFDVVIFGSCPSKLVKLRMEENKHSFINMERLFKKGQWRRFLPTTRKKITDRVLKYKNKNLYVLCSSAYASYDLSLCGFKDKCYKWGYFTQVPKVNGAELMRNKDASFCKILWAGRFIRCKRIKDAIFLAKQLTDRGYSFTMDIIGSGGSQKQLNMLVNILGLTGKVNFLGSMAPDKVRTYMERANIFICTSNFKEGWGTVVNEAMSSGCAVAASNAAGSVPYLIRHKRNGLVYKAGDVNDLYRKVIRLLNHPELQYIYGISAYRTMADIWSPEVAARRLVEVSRNLICENHICYQYGPCSKAYIIKEDWYPVKFKREAIKNSVFNRSGTSG